MDTRSFFTQMIREQKQGKAKGIYSVCSYNRYVVEAALKQAAEDNSPVLIESTCNQVNQYGGYTGMNPREFKRYIVSIAENMGFPEERIIIGGDHLGPFPFRDEDSNTAMQKARQMIEDYVNAGFTKIHLDSSPRLADDPGEGTAPLDPDIIAERCAELCSTAESAFQEQKKKNKDADAPVYVIGTDVPTPGGSDEVEEGVKITDVSEFNKTVAATKELFSSHNLHQAWDRVVAVVVQPGVEHGDHTIVEYDRNKAKDLTASLKEYPHIVFEGHTTDNQTISGLKQMVEDGIAILKVGPSLTFAAREAVFMLEYTEKELHQVKKFDSLSHFMHTLDKAMLKNPIHWEKHYRGGENYRKFSRKYSFFDRARYYWVDEQVKASLSRLISNLRSVNIPLTLISQFMPMQYRKVRNGGLAKDPEELIRDRIRDVIKEYVYAAGQRSRVGIFPFIK
ncbi:MAG: class II D-tagatose-bisphosphate aldolase, non-catalytic subunit [Spirochaetota bacterium]